MHHLFYLRSLELGKHSFHFVLFHLPTINGNNRTEIKEVAKQFTVIFGLLSSLVRYFCSLSKHPQRAVGSKVEGVAVCLHTSIMSIRCLNTEDSLHISCCRSAVSTSHHKHTSPRLYAYTRGKTSTGEGYCIRLVRVTANGFINKFKCVAAFFLFVAIACHVNHVEESKDRVLSQFSAESLGGFYTRQNPKGMSENLSKAVVRVRIERFFIISRQECEEMVNISLVYKAPIFSCAEELAEVEGFFFVAIFTHQPPKIVGVYVNSG